MNEEHNVDVLYKYRDLSGKDVKYVERIFTHNEVYFSKPLNFNDPFDCRPKFSLKANEDQIKIYLEDRLPKFCPTLSRQQRCAEIRNLIESKKFSDPELVRGLEDDHRKQFLEKNGVFCLSEIPDHILMWSHYSNSHTGICIEFESTSHAQFFELAQRVHYQIEYPILNIIENSKDEILRKALLTKAKFWEYEKEWRIVGHDTPPGVYTFPAGLLKGVILGVRITEKDKGKVMSWVNNMEYKPRIYQAQLKGSEYGLNIVRLS
jgi:hypothetical protein